MAVTGGDGCSDRDQSSTVGAGLRRVTLIDEAAEEVVAVASSPLDDLQRTGHRAPQEQGQSAQKQSLVDHVGRFLDRQLGFGRAKTKKV